LTWEWLQKTVTGKLRWLPEYFLLETLENTLIAVDGYLDEQDEQERQLRRHANFCISPYVDKNFSIERYWPIRGDVHIKQQQTKEQRIQAKLLAYRQKAQSKKNGNQT
jgi:hypothetical protein